MVQATENAVVKSTDTHLTKFEQRFKNEASQPSWLFPLRKSGIVRFAEMGFPTLNDEDWRYTNVAPIAKLPFRPIFKSSAEGLTLESVGEIHLWFAIRYPLGIRQWSFRCCIVNATCFA